MNSNDIIPTNELSQQEHCSLILGNISNEVNGEGKSNNLKVPSELLDIITKTIQQQANIKEEVKNAEKIGKSLWEVIIRPDLQAGIDNGELLWNGCSVDVRNVNTGTIAGKVQLQKFEMPENKIVDKSKLSALSDITNSICSLSGQLQIAEISKGIEIIIEKVDLIREDIWRGKISELKGINETIQEANERLPNKNASDRINGCVAPLHDLAEFFRTSIESVLIKEIEFKTINSILEGLKIWELFRKGRNEYNNDYVTKVKKRIEDYSFLVELYIQSMSLLGVCYQIIHDFQLGRKYYERMLDQIKHFSSEMVNNLVYLLDIKDVYLDNNPTLKDITKSIMQRDITITGDIKALSSKIESANDRYNQFVNQFENSKVSLMVSSDLLLGGYTND